MKEGVVCVKLSLSKGQNLMFTQAHVSCWLIGQVCSFYPRHLTLLFILSKVFFWRNRTLTLSLSL